MQSHQQKGPVRMAFLNQQEREALLDELKEKNFQQIKARLRRIDPKGRLAFFRNAQTVGRWMTRYELSGLGTRVTLVEEAKPFEKKGKLRSNFELVEIVVEPTPDNRT